MKKGDIVTIYENPLTKEKPEGRAKLVKKICDDVDMEYWQVQFLPGERNNYTRWIKK